VSKVKPAMNTAAAAVIGKIRLSMGGDRTLAADVPVRGLGERPGVVAGRRGRRVGVGTALIEALCGGLPILGK